jgi:hypothetical protein
VLLAENYSTLVVMRCCCALAYPASLLPTVISKVVILFYFACCSGALCRSYNADLLYEPWTVLDSSGEPFTTFRDFSQQ